MKSKNKSIITVASALLCVTMLFGCGSKKAKETNTKNEQNKQVTEQDTKTQQKQEPQADSKEAEKTNKPLSKDEADVKSCLEGFYSELFSLNTNNASKHIAKGSNVLENDVIKFFNPDNFHNSLKNNFEISEDTPEINNTIKSFSDKLLALASYNVTDMEISDSSATAKVSLKIPKTDSIGKLINNEEFVNGLIAQSGKTPEEYAQDIQKKIETEGEQKAKNDFNVEILNYCLNTTDFKSIEIAEVNASVSLIRQDGKWLISSME